MSFSPLQPNPDWVRRDVLKGLSLGAGATLLAPLIQQAVALAEGKSDGVQRRVVFVVQSNGLRPSFITPSGHEWKESREGGTTGGELVELSLRDRALPAALEPLTPLKDRITLLQGLSGRIAYSDHSANHGALGCYSARGVHGQTIDSALAAALPAVFPHVLLGLGANGSEAINYAHSALAANKPLPTICSPSLAFRSLFGSVDGGGKAEFDRQTNLLDFLADDVKRSAAALPASERGKLESYAEAFESLYARQREIADLQGIIRRHAPDLGEKRTTTTSSLVLEAQFEIATAALIAGLTNVVTLTSGSGHQRFGQYPELGAADLHNLGHGGSIAGKTNEESFIVIHQIHTRLIAEMAQKLSNIPEGNGSMLDNTLIVFMSDSGDGHHPRLYSWPIVLIGDLGGRLKRGGRYLEFPAYGQNKHATIGSLYATLLQAAGQSCDKFGHDDIKLSDIRQGEPLQDLLA
ncbi:MAG: DUF1552 domain-containing protein [Planctomycetales bacterium]|nr:DUF1552 domain-containing protein [Planctomycetales bacterium]